MNYFDISRLRFALLISYFVLFSVTGISQSLNMNILTKASDELLKGTYLSAQYNMAQETTSLRNQKKSFLRWNDLTGNWWGYRNQLENNGLIFHIAYTGDTYDIIKGTNNKGTYYVDNTDLQLTIDFNKLFHWKNATLFVYGLGNHGGMLYQKSGTAQGISNIEEISTWKLYQLWFEQNLFDNKISLLFGLYDLNSEFDRRETSSLFINPSQGIGIDFSQSGKNGPSIFPTTSLAFRIKYRPIKHLTIHTAVFDGVPGDPNNPYGTHIILSKNDGLLITNEIDLYNGNGTLTKGYAKYGAGVWYYTAKFPDLLDVNKTNKSILRNGNYGFYAFGEKFIYAEKNNPSQGASVFLRIGYADENVNEFNFYIGGGITYKGLISKRNDDTFGIAFASAHNGYKFRKKLSEQCKKVQPFETNIEVTYDLELTNYFHLQPDIQYVIDPANNTCGGGNSIAVGTRIYLSF